MTGSCFTWTSAGAALSAAVNGLGASTPFSWQVRAINGSGTTYANGSSAALWTFTTASAPGPFNKSAPANFAGGQSTGLTLSWGPSSGATSYEYCYDTSNDNACSTWTGTGREYERRRPLDWASVPRTTGRFGPSTRAGRRTQTAAAPPSGRSRRASRRGRSARSVRRPMRWCRPVRRSVGARAVAPRATSHCVTLAGFGCGAWTNAGTAQSVVVSGLTATSFSWQVRANNATGTTYADGSAAASWRFTVVNPPAAFSKVTPVNGATGVSASPTLAWGASSGATSYQYLCQRAVQWRDGWLQLDERGRRVDCHSWRARRWNRVLLAGPCGQRGWNDLRGWQ